MCGCKEPEGLGARLTVLFVVNGPIMCVHLETILLHVNMYVKTVKNPTFLSHSKHFNFVLFLSSYFSLILSFVYCL